MRSAQIEICQLGTYGRIYETPIDERKLRKQPFRTIDKDVQAWRNGERATNPHSDKYRGDVGTVFTQVNGPCLSLINQ
jgi:hypothetical protein